MADVENVIKQFSKWCDEQDEKCPVVCLAALALLKEQEAVVHCGDCENFVFDNISPYPSKYSSLLYPITVHTN